MMDLSSTLQIVLQEAGYRTSLVSMEHRPNPISFEDDAVMGFAVVFQQPAELLEKWSPIQTALLTRYAAALRKADQKAWNVYSIFLCSAAANETQEREIRLLEEDLQLTRKVAACNLAGHEDVVSALLPVLPIQHHPRLEGDDLTERLRRRIASFAPAAATAALDERVSPIEVIRLLREAT
ncbi:MAG: hypothetical protein ACRD3W_21305 [Terriglobales bacterium]